MVLAVLQVVLVFASSFIIGYQPMTDAPGLAFAFVIVTIFSLVSVGFGLITATISKNAEVATGIAFVFIMPQMFLGTFMPLGGAAEIAGKFMPSNYVTHAITTLFLRGAPITSVSIWIDLTVVSLIGIFVLVVGITIFRKYGIRA
jgi:ABC-type multidrug transport system permease subunit